MSGRVEYTLEAFQTALKAQGAPAREDAAVRCVMCNTVQSLRSFALHGVESDLAERQIAFSCIGRHTGAGMWDAKSQARAAAPGCDWTIGGLLGDLGRGIAVLMIDGTERHAFPIATAEECAELARRGGEPFRPVEPVR